MFGWVKNYPTSERNKRKLVMRSWKKETRVYLHTHFENISEAPKFPHQCVRVQAVSVKWPDALPPPLNNLLVSLYSFLVSFDFPFPSSSGGLDRRLRGLRGGYRVVERLVRIGQVRT